LDHGENFPASLAVLSDEDFERYGFLYRAFARGTHVRPYVPSKNGAPAPRYVTRAFGDYDYVATKDRCWLIVFERPGLWDDQTVAYLAVDLKGRWKWDTGTPIERGLGLWPTRVQFSTRPTRVTEAQFADYLAKLDLPADDSAPVDRLVFAVEHGELKEIAALVDQAGSVDALDRRGWSALAMAAQCGRTDVVEFLISKGAKINARDKAGLGRTALMRAAIAGDAKTVDTLLVHDADVHIQLDDGSLAFKSAPPAIKRSTDSRRPSSAEFINTVWLLHFGAHTFKSPPLAINARNRSGLEGAQSTASLKSSLRVPAPWTNSVRIT
jgi:hypothetical protein